MPDESFKLPLKVSELMKGFSEPWFIAGGWAVDFFLGRVTREHTDIEIAILREDQHKLRNHMSGWEFKKVKELRLESWPEDELLELPVHEIHAFNPDFDPVEIEILLNESDGSNWLFRRNTSVKRDLQKTGMISEKDGIPYLSPEIVILYKAKMPKMHDLEDFEEMQKLLDDERRSWLKKAIVDCYPGHPWLQSLGS